MIRVLIVDDSATARMLIGGVLSADSELEIVGEARDGSQAVDMARKLRPDVIVMDFQMPGLDGFAATNQIMTEAPTPIVIMSATLDVRDVAVSLDAMRAGALAILAKPPSPHSPEFERECRYFLATVKAMSQVRTVRRMSMGATGERVPPILRHSTGEKKKVIAVAASTGGPAALHAILTALPADFPVPILAVQHIAIGFADGLASWLDDASKLRVKVASNGEPLRAGTVYLSPDTLHLGATPSGTALVSDAHPVAGFRPSATFLFESVARVYGPSAVGLILTGMGEDGVAGLRTLRDLGGTVMAQDEASSIVYGMPRAAALAGLTDAILPLHLFAARLQEIV